MPKYPNVNVELVGKDGNAFAIIGRVTKALKEAGVSPSKRSDFTSEAMSGDYNHLLGTCMKWVETF